MKNPILIIVAGPNGNGKSTIIEAEELDQQDYYLNSDIIALSLIKEYPDVKARSEIAWLKTEEMRTKLIHAKVSFVWETVFSHPSRLDVVQFAKENGYIIKLIFVTTKSEYINLERVASRVKQGGHPVDSQKVIARYRKTMSLLPEIMESANTTRIYDNSEWGKQPKLVVTIEEENIVLYAQAPSWAVSAVYELIRQQL